MSNGNYDYEYLAAIAKVIQEHAMPRPYDWFVLVVAGLAIVVSGFTAYFSYRINKKQSEILEQQNKIALFGKRYEIYYDFRMMLITSGMLLKFIEHIAKKQIADDEESRKMLISKSLSILFSFTDMKKKVAVCEKELQNIVEHFQRIEEPYPVLSDTPDVLFFNFGQFSTIDPEDYINISLKKEALFSDTLDELILRIVKINKVSSLFNPTIHDKFDIICEKLGNLAHAANLYTFKELASVLKDISSYIILNNLDSLLKRDIDIIPM